MSSFTDIISQASIKMAIQKRIRLAFALQTNKPYVPLKKIFQSNDIPDSLQRFNRSFCTASACKQKFEVWFSQLLDQACFDLFDAKGRVKYTLKNLFEREGEWKTLAERCGEVSLEKYLLYSYCQQFVGERITTNNKYFQQRLDVILTAEFNIAELINTRLDKQWQRLIQQWRWMQQCAKHVEKNPKQFLVALVYVYYALYHYFDRKDERMNGDAFQQAITDIVEEIGSTGLSEEAMMVLHQQLYTIEQLVNLDKQTSTLDLKLKKKLIAEIRGFKYSDDIALHEFPAIFPSIYTILSHFMLANCSPERIVNELKKQKIVDIAVIDFVQHFAESHLPLKVGKLDEKEKEKSILNIRDKVDCYVDEVNCKKISLGQRIENGIVLRQLLLAWLQQHDGISTKLDALAVDATFLLDDIDRAVESDLRKYLAVQVSSSASRDPERARSASRGTHVINN